MTTLKLTSDFGRRTITAFVVTLLLAFSSQIAFAKAGDGTNAASRIERRINTESTSSTNEKDAREAAAAAAKKAGEDHPNDADAAKEAALKALEDLKQDNRFKNNGETVAWIEMLIGKLMDAGHLRAELADDDGTGTAEETAARIRNKPANGTSEGKARTEAEELAKKAGEDHPDDPAKVREQIEDELAKLKDKYRRQGGTLKWLEDLMAKLSDSKYTQVSLDTLQARSQGATLIVTGTVVAGEPAMVSVVDRNGATLSGVVVDIDGEEYVSDENGRIKFIVPAAAASAGLVAFLLNGEQTIVPAISSNPVAEVALDVDPGSEPFTGRPVNEAPQVSGATEHVQAGNPATIDGTNFTPEDQVSFDGTPADVLAASPNQMIVDTPQSLGAGRHEVSVENSRGGDRIDIELVELRLEASNPTLVRGQMGAAKLVVVGTEDPVQIEVTNHDANVVDLGAPVTTIHTSGGPSNQAELNFRAVGPGAFQISARVAESQTAE